MVTTMQLRAKGALTIPAELRQKYALSEGDILTLVDLGDGSFFLTPRVSIISKLVAEMEALREEAGISVEELLAGLPEQRRKLYQERYASQP
jgi:AbrB family looped-hinge helix DNA binding protein